MFKPLLTVFTMPNVIRQTRHGVETLTWIQAVCQIAHEAHLTAAQVQEALQQGEIKSSAAVYSTVRKLAA